MLKFRPTLTLDNEPNMLQLEEGSRNRNKAYGGWLTPKVVSELDLNKNQQASLRTIHTPTHSDVGMDH